MPKVYSGEHVERGKKVNLKVTKKEIYDLGQSNEWNWFITLTFDPELVDSFDFDAVSVAMQKYTRRLRYLGHKYLIVPELHDSKRYHFHGLIQGDLNVIEARNNWTGERMLDKKGRVIYNVLDYDFGFTTATQIDDSSRAATYLTKYLSKDLSGVVPKGKKRYWASKGLERPVVDYSIIDYSELGPIQSAARYEKVMHTDFGKFTLLEVD